MSKQKTLYQLQAEFFATWKKLYRQGFDDEIGSLRRKLLESDRETERILSILVGMLKHEGISLSEIRKKTGLAQTRLGNLFYRSHHPIKLKPVTCRAAKTLDDLRLPIRAYNAMHNAGLTDVSFIVQHSATQLLRYRNFGKQSLHDVQCALAECGLKLADNFNHELPERPKQPEENYDPNHRHINDSTDVPSVH